MSRCSQPKCRVAETGICLDGHDTKACPNLRPDDLVTGSVQDNVTAADSEPGPQPRYFYSGEKLNIYEASQILSDRGGRVVFCAGSQRSGKTTFLARLCEMFRDGSFSRYRFAGSLTLCGFERASWLATITSGVGHPDTSRTRRVENNTFFHLRVKPEDNQERKLDLLISDLAGETFSTALASREFCADLRGLAQADQLVCFLDCERLVDSAQRHPERNNVSAFLQRTISVKSRPELLHVHIVFSRWDYVSRNSDKVVHEEFCVNTKTEFNRRFANAFASLNFWEIAARPEGNVPRSDSQIQSIFAHWVEDPLQQAQAPVARVRRTARDFSAFGII